MKVCHEHMQQQYGNQKTGFGCHYSGSFGAKPCIEVKNYEYIKRNTVFGKTGYKCKIMAT